MAACQNPSGLSLRFTVQVVVTGQHREMLDQVLDFQLLQTMISGIMQHGQSLTYITCRVLAGLEGIISEERPEMVLVHGDTTTTFAASLAAFYQEVPVGHVGGRPTIP